MNMFCFTKDLFPYLEEKFVKFFENNKNDLSKCEYLIPDVVFDSIKEKYATVKVVPTKAVWHGVTYREDKEDLVNAINELLDEKEYPQKLWD